MHLNAFFLVIKIFDDIHIIAQKLIQKKSIILVNLTNFRCILQAKLRSIGLRRILGYRNQNVDLISIFQVRRKYLVLVPVFLKLLVLWIHIKNNSVPDPRY